ncbi:MAG: hypothetical protein M1833_002913 [Piccolia ochrophora]|nr:MAG: hypothetical protein M1833_002913 [Piccolia ochrophora]
MQSLQTLTFLGILAVFAAPALGAPVENENLASPGESLGKPVQSSQERPKVTVSKAVVAGKHRWRAQSAFVARNVENALTVSIQLTGNVAERPTVRCEATFPDVPCAGVKEATALCPNPQPPAAFPERPHRRFVCGPPTFRATFDEREYPDFLFWVFDESDDDSETYPPTSLVSGMLDSPRLDYPYWSAQKDVQGHGPGYVLDVTKLEEGGLLPASDDTTRSSVGIR